MVTEEMKQKFGNNFSRKLSISNNNSNSNSKNINLNNINEKSKDKELKENSNFLTNQAVLRNPLNSKNSQNLKNNKQIKSFDFTNNSLNNKRKTVINQYRQETNSSTIKILKDAKEGNLDAEDTII